MDKPHKKLNVWKKGIDLVTDIYSITRGFPRCEEYALSSQLRRASISIPCNIAEGAARKSQKEFLQFLSIAQGSISEVDTQLEIAFNLGYIDGKTREEMGIKLMEVDKMISGLINSVKRGVRGEK